MQVVRDRLTSRRRRPTTLKSGQLWYQIWDQSNLGKIDVFKSSPRVKHPHVIFNGEVRLLRSAENNCGKT